MSDGHDVEPALLQVSRCDLYCLFSPVIQNLRTISSSGLAPRIFRSLQRSITSIKAHLKRLSQYMYDTIVNEKKNMEEKDP